MSLLPLDNDNKVGLYSNNTIGTISKRLIPTIIPKTECPVDPNNDLLPPGYASPIADMRFGPPEQSMKRYFSLTVEDINSFHKEKIKKWIKVYEKVLGNCFRKIREHVLRDQKFCFFPVPEYLPGFPLYNITHCICFIIKKLHQAKFETKYIAPNIIYIYWNVSNQYDRTLVNSTIHPTKQITYSSNIKTIQMNTINQPSQIQHPQIQQPQIQQSQYQQPQYQQSRISQSQSTHTQQSRTSQLHPSQYQNIQNTTIPYSFQDEDPFLFG